MILKVRDMKELNVLIKFLCNCTMILNKVCVVENIILVLT